MILSMFKYILSIIFTFKFCVNLDFERTSNIYKFMLCNCYHFFPFVVMHLSCLC